MRGAHCLSGAPVSPGSGPLKTSALFAPKKYFNKESYVAQEIPQYTDTGYPVGRHSRPGCDPGFLLRREFDCNLVNLVNLADFNNIHLDLRLRTGQSTDHHVEHHQHP